MTYNPCDFTPIVRRVNPVDLYRYEPTALNVLREWHRVVSAQYNPCAIAA